MSAISKLPFMAGTISLGAGLAALAAIPALRERVELIVGPSLVRNALKALILAILAVNVKNLPLVWHWRVFKGIIYQIYFQPSERTPRTLFAPMITSSYNSPYDTDYNLHKSNSTYFADLDVARAHYASSIIKTGLTRLNAGDEDGLPAETRSVKGRYYLALGAVACYFHREIAPLAQFEIHTRLLAWDRKWMYLVSHVVKKDRIKPTRYALQPWKKGARARDKNTGNGKGATNVGEEEDWKKHIYASSVARYVLKKGRLTINPEVVLERSRLLPKRPDGVGLPPRAESSIGTTPVMVETPSTIAKEKDDATSPEAIAAAVSSKLNGVAKDGEIEEEESDWTWEEMEAERLRGLMMASHFDALSGLQDELKVGEVLGRYSDWF